MTKLNAKRLLGNLHRSGGRHMCCVCPNCGSESMVARSYAMVDPISHCARYIWANMICSCGSELVETGLICAVRVTPFAEDRQA